MWSNAQGDINDFVWKITRNVGHFVKIADKTLRKICGNAAFPPSHWPIHFGASYWLNLKAFIFIAFGTLWQGKKKKKKGDTTPLASTFVLSPAAA